MSTTTTTTTQTTLQAPKLGMALDGRPTNYNDFRDQLNRDGYAVIKGAVPRDRADKYADKFLSYIEGLYVPPSTFSLNLPSHHASLLILWTAA